MRLVIELKRGGDPAKVVLNQLYKRTQMQQSFGINMVALVDGVPRTLSLLEAISHYVVHQRDVITRRTQHQLARAEARAHILEGLLIALDNLDAVIKLIRGSKDPDAARDGLIDKFTLTRPQAQAILDMRLQRLTALEADKIREEHAELSKRSRSSGRSSPTRRRCSASSSPSSVRSPSAMATIAGPRSPPPRASSTSRT